MTQADLDEWIAIGASTRLSVNRFLAWTRASGITDAAIVVPKHRRGTAPRLAYSEQERALEHVLGSGQLTPRDRLAAVLVLVFAQPIQRIVQLTWDDIEIRDDCVAIDLGGFPTNLTSPLDEVVRDLAKTPGHSQTAAHPDSPWVFRSGLPGAHLGAMHLRQRLRLE